MNDLQDDYYQCIGYCQADPDTGVCLGCGRPSPGTFAVIRRPDAAAGTGLAPIAPENRFPVDPLL